VGAEDEPIACFAAEGGGRQRIVVVPSLDLVMVSTGGGFDWDTLIGGVVATVTDGWRPLPADPEGQAALATALPGLAGGHWLDERTLVVEVDEGPGLHAYEMTSTFGPRMLLLETFGLAITGVPVAHGG
jgi:hypothetical protein